MKGVVFTILNDMVEEKMGMDVWDTMLNKAETESDGVYISGETYPDAELFSLISALSEIKSIPTNALIKAFGHYSFDVFVENYGMFFENHTAKSFLMSVEDVIHVEVRKLYSQPALLTFSYEDIADNKLVMTYRSPRRLFDFAEGLIERTGDYYHTPIHIDRVNPVTPDSDTCQFYLTFL